MIVLQAVSVGWSPLFYSNWQVKIMKFNAIINNMSAISWRLVLLAEETTDLSQVTDILYYIML